MSKGNTNQPGPSTDQATKRIPGPLKNTKSGNATKGGGINRATTGKP